MDHTFIDVSRKRKDSIATRYNRIKLKIPSYTDRVPLGPRLKTENLNEIVLEYLDIKVTSKL